PSRRVATGSSPCGRRISNDSPRGRSSRRSRSKPGSTATPEPETPARPPLRVALDAQAFAEDATGVGRYIGALIEAFRASPSVDLMPYRDSGPRLIGPHLALPQRMRWDGARRVHGPANALPLLNTGLPGVVTIHDLAIYDHPEWFPAGQWWATRVVVPQSARRARMIICPSEATKRATVRLFDIEPDRCRVIPHGVETEFALPALYQMAQAVLFPSLDEGFGLPLVEAFAAGAPVVASNAGAIPEVAGDAALLSAPEDAQALADNLLRLLTDRPLRERQVAAGRARAALYTWPASAAAHREVYESVVSPSRASTTVTGV